MKLVRFEDMPVLCNAVLEEVTRHGTIFVVVKDGEPWVRIEPDPEQVREWCWQISIAKGKMVPLREPKGSKVGSRRR